MSADEAGLVSHNAGRSREFPKLNRQSESPRLVADIGGTNARCSLAKPDPGAPGEWLLSGTRVVECNDHDGLEEVLDEYLAGEGGVRPRYGCIAVAGPVTGDRVALTNLDWEFSAGDLRRRLRFERLEVINDCAAVACATSVFHSDQFSSLVAGEAQLRAPRVVIGCGTGVGVSALVHDGQRWLPLAGEGGHATASSFTEREHEVLRAARTLLGHVSAETLLSGPGLRRIYKSLALLDGISAPDYTPEEITSLGIARGDALCSDAVQVFAGLLGGFVGNVTLTYGATGGAYLSGNLLRSVQSVLASDSFATAFRNKGAMSDYLNEVPVYLVEEAYPGLVGAAAWLSSTLKRDAAIA